MYVPYESQQRPARSRRRRPLRLGLENLEPRLALTTFVVTSIGDQPAVDPTLGADTAAGTVTLRSAIQAANAHVNDPAGLDRIEFNIPGAGVKTIAVSSTLPAVADAVVIDGYTQPGAKANTLAQGSDAVLLVALDNPLGLDNALTIQAGGSTVRGLIINRFSGNAVTLAQRGGNTVAGNYLGLPAEGNVGIGNGVGVAITAGSNGNTIGGVDPASRNWFAGSLVGLRIVASSNNLVQGNYFGLTPSGLGVLPNGQANIVVTSGTVGDATGPAAGNLIGGTVPGARNVLAAAGAGIVFGGDQASLTTGNTVAGNFIGTDANGIGTASFGHNGPGIRFDVGAGATPDGPSQNTIGGPTPEARNIIANNNQGVVVGLAAVGTVIQGNYVGLDVSGAAAARQGTEGILVQGSQTSLIGNVVGRHAVGIAVDGGEFTTIQGNLVGTDAAGGHAVPNGIGIELAAATDTTIGGASAAERNVISGNSAHGIALLGSGIHNHILGNFIGTDVTGQVAVRNLADGIHVDFFDANANNRDTLIGGPDPGAGNRIGFNGGSGVSIRNSTAKHETDGVIDANTIFSNAQNGILLAVGNVSAPHYRITRNSIAFNGWLGIDLGEDGVTANDARGHEGPNAYQNVPTITAVTTTAAATLVSGIMRDAPGKRLRLEFFASATPDATGHGEGQTYLGFAFIEVDNSGQAVFTDVPLPALPAGQTFVTATATDADGDTSEFSQVFAASPTQAAADLSVTATVDPGQAAAGGLLTYTLTVANHGPSGADDVTFRSAVPTEATFVSFATPTGWTATTPSAGGTGNVSATLGHLDSGATAVFTLVVRVNPAAPGGTTLTAAATVTTATADPDGSNNSTAVSATLPPAPDHTDLALSVVASSHSVHPGQTLTFTITVTNNSSLVAGLNILRMDIPAHTTYRSATAPDGWVTTPPVGGTGTLLSQRGNIDVGATAVLTITVDVDPSAPLGGTITGLATIVSETPDSNPLNNTASDSATVSPTLPANLDVTIGCDRETVAVGQDVTYAIVLSNPGGTTATGVQLHVDVPSTATVVSTGGGTRTPTGIDLNVGVLAPGATRRVPITIHTRSVGTITLTAHPAADPGVIVGNPASVSTAVLGGDTTPPTVLGVARYGYHNQPTLLVVTFSEDVNPSLAGNAGNYVVLVQAGRGERAVPLSAVSYDARTHQATLRMAGKIYLYHPWRLIVRGEIADQAGNALAGDGVSGHDHVARMDRRTLSGPASAAPGAAQVGVRAVPLPVPAGPRAHSIRATGARPARAGLRH